MRPDDTDTRITKLCACIKTISKALDDAPLDSRETLDKVLDALGNKVIELLVIEIREEKVETEIS